MKKLLDVFNKIRAINKPDDNGYEHIIRMDCYVAWITSEKDDGRLVSVCGTVPEQRRFKVGDRVLFVKIGGSKRYRILKVHITGYKFFMDCEFYPLKELK